MPRSVRVVEPSLKWPGVHHFHPVPTRHCVLHSSDQEAKERARCVKPGTMTPATLPHNSHPNAVSLLLPEHTHTQDVQLRLHNSRNSHANPQAHTFPEPFMHNLPGLYNHRHRGSAKLQQRSHNSCTFPQSPLLPRPIAPAPLLLVLPIVAWERGSPAHQAL